MVLRTPRGARVAGSRGTPWERDGIPARLVTLPVRSDDLNAISPRGSTRLELFVIPVGMPSPGQHSRNSC